MYYFCIIFALMVLLTQSKLSEVIVQKFSRSLIGIMTSMYECHTQAF